MLSPEQPNQIKGGVNMEQEKSDNKKEKPTAEVINNIYEKFREETKSSCDIRKNEGNKHAGYECQECIDKASGDRGYSGPDFLSKLSKEFILKKGSFEERCQSVEKVAKILLEANFPEILVSRLIHNRLERFAYDEGIKIEKGVGIKKEKNK
jgi:hypothetical protein